MDKKELTEIKDSSPLDVHIQFKIAESDRAKFQAICDAKSINPSHWLRQQVYMFNKLNESKYVK